MTEIHSTLETTGRTACTVRNFVNFQGDDAAGDPVVVAIVCFDFVVASVVFCVARNMRTGELMTRVASSLIHARQIMDAWIGGGSVTP